jgi:hypothetical protein
MVLTATTTANPTQIKIPKQRSVDEIVRFMRCLARKVPLA